MTVSGERKKKKLKTLFCDVLLTILILCELRTDVSMKLM